nr:hypothetical protein [Tanacetum cinerariifolium]
MQSDLWPKIKKGIEQHLAKIYTDNKSTLKAEYWVANPDDGTYDVESIRSRRPTNISVADLGCADCLLEEILRLLGLGTYTDDQIMAIVRRGKQRGHILGVGRVLAGRGRDVLVSPEPRCTHTLLTYLQSHHEVGSGSESGAGGDDESGDDEDADEDEEDEDS